MAASGPSFAARAILVPGILVPALLACAGDGPEGFFHVLAEEFRDGFRHKAGLAAAHGLPFVEALFPEGGVGVGFLERKLEGKACVLAAAFVNFFDGVDVAQKFKIRLA